MNKKILIVDDSKVSRMFAINFWKNFDENWSFFEADCGEKALGFTDENQFDVIILDYNMPGIDGLSAAREILKNQSNCFIALLTANVQRHIKEEAKQANIFFFCKPVTPEVIKNIMHNMEEHYNALQ